MPTYLLMMLFFWKLLPLIGNDSQYYNFITLETEGCKYFWRNVLFIDNLYDAESCFGWGWYLSADF